MAFGDKYWDHERGVWVSGVGHNAPDYQPVSTKKPIEKEVQRDPDPDYIPYTDPVYHSPVENENPFLTLTIPDSIPYTETKVDGEVTTNSTVKIDWSKVQVSAEPFIINNSYKQIDYKYNEAHYLGELRAYIDSTYDQHYSQNQFQATEFIIDGGHGTGFCIGNVLKYAQRYGRKGTPADWRKDLMKVIHYAVIQLHVHDLENGDKK